MRKYRIAFLGLKGIPAVHGADRVAESVAEQLANTFEVTIYCKKGYGQGLSFNKGIMRRIIPTVPIKNLDMFLYFLMSALHACFIKRYDMVHVHNIDCAYILPLLRLIYRNRILSTSHGNPYEREKWGRSVKQFFRYLEKKFLRYSPRITAVAEPLKRYYEQTYGVSVDYIPNGVHAPQAEPIDASHDPQEYILFAAGRILPSKGCHIFLEAMKTVEYPGEIYVVGDLSEMPDYSSQLQRMAPTNTRFIGFITSKENLMGYVKRSRIFVFPSTYEAASMMLLESISQGVPTIVSDIPENKSLLVGPDAIFFESGNAKDLSEKIIKVLRDYDQAVNSARRLQHYILQEYSWSKIAGSYGRLYREALFCN